MIHCPKCGQQNADEFEYCLSCGNDLKRARALLAHTSLAGMASSSSSSLPPIPPPPREPTARTRGVVYAYTGSQRVLFIIGLGFMIVGLVGFLLVGHRLIYDLALDVAGQRDHAQLVDVKVDSDTSVNDVHPRLLYFVRQGVRGHSATLDHKTPFARGQVVDVDVLPQFPEAARVHGTMCSALGYFAAFPLVFFLVGAPMFVRAVLSNRREVRAFKRGLGVVARVVDFTIDTTVSINGRNPRVLTWEFDVDGKTYRGSISHMEQRVLQPLIVNQRVAVVYDARDPSVNTVYVV